MPPLEAADEAFRLFQEMVQEGLVPSSTVLTHILTMLKHQGQSCNSKRIWLIVGRIGHVDRMLAVFDFMRSTKQPFHVFHCDLLLAAFARVRNLQKMAEVLANRTQDSGVNSTLFCSLQVVEIYRSLKPMDEMISDGSARKVVHILARARPNNGNPRASDSQSINSTLQDSKILLWNRYTIL